MASQLLFSLRRRLQLCLVMLALESYICFEEIFMVSVLQRIDVPIFLVSMPGTASSLIGVFVIPILGWASDRCGLMGTLLIQTVFKHVWYWHPYYSTKTNPFLTGCLQTGTKKYYETALATERRQLAMASQPLFSLRRRLQLCLVMLALESYISFGEIFMVSVLQQIDVPIFLVSMTGAASSLIGVFVIPILGWASDRFTSPFCGQKRPFAAFTLILSIAGTSIIVGVTANSLYTNPDGTLNSTSTNVTDPRLLNVSLTGLPATTDDLKSTRISRETTASPSFEDVQTAFLSESASTGSYSVSPELNFAADSSSVLAQNDSFAADAATASSAISDKNSSLSPPAKDSSGSLVSLVGIMGMVGFIVAEHGYDSSFSTFKSYMIAVTTESQHDDVFVLGTLVGAVGGCLTSLLGFVDLPAIFFQAEDTEIDKGIAQCFVQAVFLLILLVLLGFCSLVTGSEKLPPEGSIIYSVANDEASIISERRGGEEPTYGAMLDGRVGDTDINEISEETFEEKDGRYIDGTDDTQLSSAEYDKSTTKWKRVKRRVFLCVMTFLSLSGNYAYFVYVTNYVAEVIFNGSSHAQAGSVAYRNYLQGEHIASLGMLTFYILYVVFNLFHHKIISKIGMRAEYMGSSVACAALMFILAYTNSIIVFFIIAATMAVFRSAVYTIPYILSNNYSQEELKEDSDDRDETQPGSKTSGTSMASVAAMIPASFFLVSLLMGPLMAATGNAGTPVLFAAASCLLGFVSTLFVQF